jgi:hypothetical protein
MTTTIDKEAVRQAYDSVRDDKIETNWALFKYEGPRIVCSAQGVEYSEFLELFDEADRCFAFVRMFTGDELSKRAKFAFITWIGSSVGALKRARVSIDKTLVKDVVTSFAVELAASDKVDLDEKNLRELIQKAGGANYGSGGG